MNTLQSVASQECCIFGDDVIVHFTLTIERRKRRVDKSFNLFHGFMFFEFLIDLIFSIFGKGMQKKVVVCAKMQKNV